MWIHRWDRRPGKMWALRYVVGAAVCIVAGLGAADEPAAPSALAKDWLELAVGADEHALFRHEFRAVLLAQVQALVWDKPAAGQKAPLDVLNGTLVVRRGRRTWLDLSQVENDAAAELRRLAAAQEPHDRLDLLTELRDHVAQVYHDRLAPYRSLADLQRDHPYRNNAEYLAVPVDSDFFAGRRVIYVAKDRVADALAAYADEGDRVIYPAKTAIIAEARSEKDEVRDTEVLWKRADGYWTALIFDERGKLVHDATVERGKGKNALKMTASFNCFACHRISREDKSNALGESGFNHLERLDQRLDTPWPAQVHLGPEYRERAAYRLTETELRQRDGVFGPYGSLLLTELMHKQKHSKLSDSDRRRYERLQPHFPQQLPPLNGT